ncbi:MAG: hypothetical protein HY922_10445 [Elusimicrobia bacterium]|nr:hypothetical protein [Elusimicrobiota bacterium]
MKTSARGPACVGVTEVRPVTSRLYGIRVQRHLISKLKKVPELHHPNPKSDLFCVEVGSMENSPEGALMRFGKIVAKAGLGLYFGIETSGQDAMK